MNEKTYTGLTQNITSGTIAAIHTVTPVKATKKSRATGEANPYGEVVKSVRQTTHLGIKSYEGLVNTHREREGMEADFEAKEAWYTKESPFLGHGKKNGKAVMLVNDEGMSVQETKYFTADGTELVGEALEDFKANYAPKPSTYDNQGTEAKVRIRAIYLDNVREVKVGGVTYA